MPGPVAAMLPDGERLHLQHGPIDLLIAAEGNGQDARQRAFAAAARRFETVLTELVEELPLLRSASTPASPPPHGRVARRMDAAVRPHGTRGAFVTPMAAVAGAVAEEILAAMLAAGPLERAYVNNGGDIALHLTGERHFDVLLAGLDGADLGRVRINAGSPVRGIATSGRGGRSLTLGIADSVTVLAGKAAAADVAATLIANAVDLAGHPAVTRRKAREIQPDSDLGDRPVVTACAPLAAAEITRALDRGASEAEFMLASGLIAGAALFLQGEARAIGKAVAPGAALPVDFPKKSGREARAGTI